jgi:hypothetical protein
MKARHLVLTTERVVCVKVKKGMVGVKWEAVFAGGGGVGVGASAGGGKEEGHPGAGVDAGKLVVTDVQKKGEKGFVAVTVRVFCASLRTP